MTQTGRQRGFTLTDLWVLIVIIGVLLGLTLTSVQSSRRTVCRVYCSSHLRQIGLGLTGYLTANQSFPNAGTFGEPASTIANPGTDPKISIIGLSLGIGGSPAFAGAPAGQPTDPTEYGALYSWVVDILPYIDAQDIYDGWDRTKRFYNTSPNTSGASNFTLSQTDISILRCPEDLTVVRSRGNLSYVVNGGFARWWAVPTWGWTSLSSGGRNDDFGTDWSGSGDIPYSASIARKTAVMFLGTAGGNLPWDTRTIAADIVDGAANTLLAAENQWAGAAPWDPALMGPDPGGATASWAIPHPNFCMFIGSDKICGTRGNCLRAGLGIVGTNPQTDGPGWKAANVKQAKYLEYINAGNAVTREGYSPFPNSPHAGGLNVVLCDGSVRFIGDTIDGTLWAKMITPQGSKLPYSATPGTPSYRQLDLEKKTANNGDVSLQRSR